MTDKEVVEKILKRIEPERWKQNSTRNDTLSTTIEIHNAHSAAVLCIQIVYENYRHCRSENVCVRFDGFEVPCDRNVVKNCFRKYRLHLDKQTEERKQKVLDLARQFVQ